MNRESVLLIDIWEAVSDVIPPAKRHDAAVGIIRAFEEYGIEIADLSHISDEDPLLAKAYAEAAQDEDEPHHGYDEEE